MRVNIGPGGTPDLDNFFTYHPPHGGQVEAYERIRNAGKELAEVISQLAPGSPERSIAITKVREAVMWANAAIACNDPEPSYVVQVDRAITEDEAREIRDRFINDEYGDGDKG